MRGGPLLPVRPSRGRGQAFISQYCVPGNRLAADGSAAAAAAKAVGGLTVRSGFSAAAMLGVGAFCYPLVSETGLGSLLTSRFTGGLDNKFYGWVLTRLDPDTMRMECRDGQTRCVNKEAVARILGIKSGDRKISIGCSRGRSTGSLVEEVQYILGLPVGRVSGISVDDLKRVCLICNPDSLNPREAAAAKVAYTLLAVTTYVAPKHPGTAIPEELLECVLVPDEIGLYDWAGYVLDTVRLAAIKLQGAYLGAARTCTLQGCNPFLMIFYFDWMDFASLVTDLVPRISAYTTEKMNELIRLDTADRHRSSPIYRTRPEGFMEQLPRRAHPLISGMLGRQQGAHRLRQMVYEVVIAKLKDAVNSVISGMNDSTGDAEQSEQRRASLVESVFATVNAQGEDIYQKLVEAIYPQTIENSGGQGPRVPCQGLKGKQAMPDAGEEGDVMVGEGNDNELVLDDNAFSSMMRRMCRSEDAAPTGSVRGANQTTTLAVRKHKLESVCNEMVLIDQEGVAAGKSVDEMFTQKMTKLYSLNEVFPAAIIEKLTSDTINETVRVAVATLASTGGQTGHAAMSSGPSLVPHEEPVDITPTSAAETTLDLFPLTPLYDTSTKRSSQDVSLYAPKRVRLSHCPTTGGTSRMGVNGAASEEHMHAGGGQRTTPAADGLAASNAPALDNSKAGIDRTGAIPIRGSAGGAMEGNRDVGQSIGGDGEMGANRLRDEGQAVTVKVELNDKFPGDANMAHERPIATDVFTFHDYIMASPADELAMNWVIHKYPSVIEVTGLELKLQLGERHAMGKALMAATGRLLRQLENKMTRGSAKRWRHPFDPQLAEELMEHTTVNTMDLAYLRTVLAPDHVGYSLMDVQKLMLPMHLLECWFLYVVDIKNKLLVVLDLTSTEDDGYTVKRKHEQTVIKVMNGLRRAIHHVFRGQWEVPKFRWGCVYSTGLHPPCTRSESGLIVVHYMKEYNRLGLNKSPSQTRNYLPLELALQPVMMQGNRGHLPGWLKTLMNPNAEK